MACFFKLCAFSHCLNFTICGCFMLFSFWDFRPTIRPRYISAVFVLRGVLEQDFNKCTPINIVSLTITWKHFRKDWEEWSKWIIVSMYQHGHEKRVSGVYKKLNPIVCLQLNLRDSTWSLYLNICGSYIENVIRQWLTACNLNKRKASSWYGLPVTNFNSYISTIWSGITYGTDELSETRI